jgi:hypothetical protein
MAHPQQHLQKHGLSLNIPPLFLTLHSCSSSQFTEDDIVGCLELGLGRMHRDGPIDGWEPLIRPAVRTFTGRLWQRLTGPRPLAELRLTASAQECGVDQTQDPEEGQPAEVLKNSAASNPEATENLILTGRPLPSTRTSAPIHDGMKSGGMYAALAFESDSHLRPPRAQQSTLSPSPELLPSEAVEPSVMLAKPRADSPSLAAAPDQQNLGRNGGRVDARAPGSSAGGDGEGQRRSVMANIIEPLNCFNGVH